MLQEKFFNFKLRTGRKQPPKNRDNSEMFIKCKRDISNDNYHQTEKVPIHRKRPAPKPPMTKAKTTTPATEKTDNNGFATTKDTAQNETDNAHDDHLEFIEQLIESTIKLETLESLTNARREEEEPIDKPVLNIKINKLGEKDETKQKKDNIDRKTKTAIALTAADREAQQHRANNGASETLPILTGNKTPNVSLATDRTVGKYKPTDQQLKPQSHPHQPHVKHERGKNKHKQTKIYFLE